MQNNLAESMLSPSAVHAIIEIGKGTASNASDIASLLRLEKSTVSRLLKRLDQKGLVAATASKSDARLYTLKLSEDGWVKFHEIESYARGQVQVALNQVPSATIGVIANGLAAYANVLRPALRDEEGQEINPTKVVFRSGYQPTLLGYTAAMHASFYSKNYNFGALFECKVATEMGEFLGRIDKPKNTVFSAHMNGRLVGSVSIDSEDLGPGIAHLRWFIVDGCAKGLGVGKELLSRAVKFVDQEGFSETHLWTFKGLQAARHLYEKMGFRLVDEKVGSQWGKEVREQMFIRNKVD